MVSDLDEQGLYPPDVEELTPAVREHRNRVAVGTALVVWGLALLVQRALGVDLDTFWLGLGLAGLAGWTQAPRYSWFVAGSVMTGLGAGELLSSVFDNAFGAALSLLLIGVGFTAVYVRYPRRSSWALPVAAVFALLAVGSFGIALIGLVPAALGRFLLPLLLIGGGGLLLMRHSLPPKAVKAGLAALAVSFVLVGATSVPGIDSAAPDVERRTAAPGPPRPLPLEPGDKLVMVSEGSGDILLRTGDPAVVEVGGRRRGGGIAIRRRPDGVSVGPDRHRGDGDSVDYVVTLPPDIEVEIQRGSGSVRGDVHDVRGAIRTDSGDIELRILSGRDEELDLASARGAVKVVSEVELDVVAVSDAGTVELNGRRRESRQVEVDASGDVLDLEVRTGEGDIELDLPAESPAAPDAPSDD